MARFTHRLPDEFFKRQVNILVVGAGGNGSRMLAALAELQICMSNLRIGHDFNVELADADTVSATNVGRQLFSPGEVGLSKAQALVQRANLQYGLGWTAHEGFVTSVPQDCDILVTCTDTVASRRQLAATAGHARYWLDLGNESRDGQVVLGEPAPTWDKRTQRKSADDPMRLPTVVELFAHTFADNAPEPDTPSCSYAEAIRKQGLFVNQQCAVLAADLLFELFVGNVQADGSLDRTVTRHGGFFNQRTCFSGPLRIDTDQWRQINPDLQRKWAALPNRLREHEAHAKFGARVYAPLRRAA